MYYLGIFVSVNKKYEGEWENNKKHGNGKMEWTNGNKYEGQYVKDKNTELEHSIGQAEKIPRSLEKWKQTWKRIVLQPFGI